MSEEFAELGVKRSRDSAVTVDLVLSAPLPLVWLSLIGELSAGEKEKQGGKRSEWSGDK